MLKQTWEVHINCRNLNCDLITIKEALDVAKVKIYIPLLQQRQAESQENAAVHWLVDYYINRWLVLWGSKQNCVIMKIHLEMLC